MLSSTVKEESNVIIRNIGISKVLAENGDAIGVRKFSQLAYPPPIATSNNPQS